MTWLEAGTIVVVMFILYLIVVSYCEMKKTLAVEETKRVQATPVTNIFGMPIEHPRETSST